MRRYKKRSRSWKRIWRANGVSGGGSKLENWILRLIMGFSGFCVADSFAFELD